MKFNDALSLIDNGSIESARVTQWADLGAGTGLFTKALASLLGDGSTVYAIDKKMSIKEGLPGNRVAITGLAQDFLSDDLKLPPLDGILMANSIHYVPDKPAFIKRISRLLKPEAGFLIVEYDLTRGNQWVPYPLPFRDLPELFGPAGFPDIQPIKQIPSMYHNANIYGSSINR